MYSLRNTQSVINRKEVMTNHPVAYVSGMFRGSQLNWAAMMKEAYAIYMTVKKSKFISQVLILHSVIGTVYPNLYLFI